MKTYDKMPAMSGDLAPLRTGVSVAYASAETSTPSDISLKTSSVKTADGASISLVIWSPGNSSTVPNQSGRPLVIFIHGGGFVLGSPYMDAAEAHRLVREYSAVCISIDYRLAPEHPFPGPVHDCWAGVQWAAANAADLGASPATAGFVLIGSSAGANIATAIAYLARDEALSPPLTGVIARMPQYFVPKSVPSNFVDQYLSWEQCHDADALPIESVEYFDAFYKPDHSSPLFSPLAQPNGHVGLPLMYLQVCGYDPLRDDGLIYARVLKQAGCRVELDVYKGVPHGFYAFYPMLEVSTKFMNDAAEAAGRILKVK